MAPVPFTGEVVISPAGEYRVVELATEKGTHVLQMRKTQPLLDITGQPILEWVIGYAFRLPEIDEAMLNQTQAMTAESETSPFNKDPVVVKRTDTGHLSLTPDTLTTTVNGERTKEAVSPSQFDEILKDTFGLKTR